MIERFYMGMIVKDNRTGLFGVIDSVDFESEIVMYYDNSNALLVAPYRYCTDITEKQESSKGE